MPVSSLRRTRIALAMLKPVTTGWARNEASTPRCSTPITTSISPERNASKIDAWAADDDAARRGDATPTSPNAASWPVHCSQSRSAAGGAFRHAATSHDLMPSESSVSNEMRLTNATGPTLSSRDVPNNA